MKQDDDTDQDISDGNRKGEGEYTGWSLLLSNIVQDDFDTQQGVLLLGQAHRIKSLQTTKESLLKK
jgi:hypothetical protein